MYLRIDITESRGASRVLSFTIRVYQAVYMQLIFRLLTISRALKRLWIQ